MPAASYALLPNLKNLFFSPSERDRIFCRLFSSQQRPYALVCTYQTPGWRPPHITGRFMNTMTRRWVGAPKERAAVSFHDAVVDFCRSMSVEDSDSRRFELTFGWGFLRPILAQHLPRNYFFPFFLQVWNFFFEDLCSWRAVQKSYGVYL